MSAIDRNALATDLEDLGLKAISSSVRRDTASVERALKQVERLRDRSARLGDAAKVDASNLILNRYRREGP